MTKYIISYKALIDAIYENPASAGNERAAQLLEAIMKAPEITDEEFKEEAKRRGYNLIKKPEYVKLLPCVCGRKRLQQMWCSYNYSYFRCPKCLIYSEKGKNDRKAKLNWNKMIEEKMKEE